MHIKNETGATDYKWESFQWKAVTGEGFAWSTLDKNGFNNSKIPTSVDVLLMGSSHMEAVNIPQDKNCSSVLSSMVEGVTTYNIGVSGHTIYSCLQNLRDAVSCYHPDRYVVIETSTIDLDVNKMEQVIQNIYPEIPSYDSGLLYFVQKNIPIIKALYQSFDEWYSSTSKKDDVIVQSEERTYGEIDDNAHINEYNWLLNQMLAKASEAASQSGAKLIIVYQPSTKIDREGTLIKDTNESRLASFQEACDSNNIIFVDMSEDFERLYREQHILAHGFINTAVGEGHLNQYGHRVIAERLALVIGGDDRWH